MNYEKIVAELIRKYGINSEQVYHVGTDFNMKVIIRKEGLDQIEETLSKQGWEFRVAIESSHPYGSRAYTIVKTTGTRGDELVETMAGANPDNCHYHHYAEVAEKRARHRCILRIAELTKHKIHSEVESHTFVPDDVGEKKSKAVVKEAEKWAGDAPAKPFDKAAVMKDINKLVKQLDKIEKENDEKAKEVIKREDSAPEKGAVDSGAADSSKPKSRRSAKGAFRLPKKNMAEE